MNKNDLVRLRHMLDAAREAVDFVQDKTQEDLFSDRMLALSLIKLVEIIGEAAASVSTETQNLFPQIPWQNAIRIRNRLIHGYFDINLGIVWDTVRDNLPPLIAELEKIIAAEGG
jgi:uncharacterized protein with HEPN domain